MASIQRRWGRKSKIWRAVFMNADGRKCYKSTGATDRRTALQIAIEYEKAARLGRQKRLTEAQARKAIASIFAVANADALPTAAVRDYLKEWLAAKSLEIADRSVVEYEHVVADFIASLGKRASLPLDAIGQKDVLSWRARMAERVSAGTVNRNLKILQGAWTAANRAGLVDANVVRQVGSLKADRKAGRRAFTIEELRRILAAASPEWRGAVLFGIYTGQRLGDVASLTWSQIDTGRHESYFTQQKTGARITIPLAQPLTDWLATAPASDAPGSPLFPELSGCDQSTLSRQFRGILEACGIVPKLTAAEREHKATGKGRSARRKQSDVSFHCLRHTAASLLHDTGAGQAVAQAILGHKSEAVHQRYVHVETDAKRRAVEALPDITTEIHE